MSDNSSNSGSARSLRITKKKAKSVKKNTKKSTKSVKKSVNTRKLRVGNMIGQTRVGPALKKVLGITTLRNENQLRRNIRKSRKAYKSRYGKSYERSPNSLDPVGLTKAEQKALEKKIRDRAYRRIGRKVGHELNAKDKKKVLEALSSTSPNEIALIQKLRMGKVFNEFKNVLKEKKEVLKEEKKRLEHARQTLKAQKKERHGIPNALAGKDFNEIERAIEQRERNVAAGADKEAGKAEYEERKAQYTEEKKDLENRIKANKIKAKADLEAYYKSIKSDKKPSETDILALATLTAHGFHISAGEHRHLKKHILDNSTIAIKDRLIEQIDSVSGLSACDICVLLEYLKTV
jgi:hypothetical protein